MKTGPTGESSYSVQRSDLVGAYNCAWITAAGSGANDVIRGLALKAQSVQPDLTLVPGVVVNLPPWDFGQLLGVYVTLFFLVAQLINWFGFGLKPTVPILVGGALIMTGGLVISFWGPYLGLRGVVSSK